jgi:hypothetical protein
MIDREASAKNSVCGEETSSFSSPASKTSSTDSKRFLGLPADPRPRSGRGLLCMVHRQKECHDTVWKSN